MKNWLSAITICFSAMLFSCNNSETETKTVQAEPAANPAGQSAVQDSLSQKNVVQVAVASKDHTTLVTAVKAAELVDVLSNAGPFTVFAPTNAAFDKLPAGTVDGLLKPEKKDDLTNILQYHVSVGVYKEDAFRDGQVIGQVNGDNITITKKDGKIHSKWIGNYPGCCSCFQWNRICYRPGIDAAAC